LKTLLPKDTLNSLAEDLRNVREINDLDVRTFKKRNIDKIVFPGISAALLKPKLLPNKYKFF
jgi:hypothetical protein